MPELIDWYMKWDLWGSFSFSSIFALFFYSSPVSGIRPLHALDFSSLFEGVRLCKRYVFLVCGHDMLQHVCQVMRCLDSIKGRKTGRSWWSSPICWINGVSCMLYARLRNWTNFLLLKAGWGMERIGLCKPLNLRVVIERISEQEGGKYKTDVYVAQCSDLKCIFPICTNWEYACWAMVKS